MNDNTNLPEIHSARKIPLSELRGLLLSEKLSLPDYLSSLFVDRLVVNVRVEDGGRFWLFEFDQGPPVYIEPIVTNHGCHGMCAGLSSDSDSDSVLPNSGIMPLCVCSDQTHRGSNRCNSLPAGRTSSMGVAFVLFKASMPH